MTAGENNQGPRWGVEAACGSVGEFCSDLAESLVRLASLQSHDLSESEDFADLTQQFVSVLKLAVPMVLSMKGFQQKGIYEIKLLRSGTTPIAAGLVCGDEGQVWDYEYRQAVEAKAAAERDGA